MIWGTERKTRGNQGMNDHLCRWARGSLEESDLGFAPCNGKRAGELGELLGIVPGPEAAAAGS